MKKIVFLISFVLIGSGIFAQEKLPTGSYFYELQDKDGKLVATFDAVAVKSFGYDLDAETGKYSIIVVNANGNSMFFADVASIVPRKTSPASDTWDLEKTFAIGGGSYGIDVELYVPMAYQVEFISVVSKTSVIIYDVAAQKETRYPRSGIADSVLNKANAVLTFAHVEEHGAFPAISYPVLMETGKVRHSFDNFAGKWLIQSAVGCYDFNGGTNKIPSTFVINGDGSLTVSYFNYAGVLRSHTFKK